MTAKFTSSARKTLMPWKPHQGLVYKKYCLICLWDVV